MRHANEQPDRRSPPPAPGARDSTLDGQVAPASAAALDITGDFCCPDYIVLMVQKIQSNWKTQVENSGEVKVKFTIERSGADRRPAG